MYNVHLFLRVHLHTASKLVPNVILTGGGKLWSFFVSDHLQDQQFLSFAISHVLRVILVTSHRQPRRKPNEKQLK